MFLKKSARTSSQCAEPCRGPANQGSVWRNPSKSLHYCSATGADSQDQGQIGPSEGHTAMLGRQAPLVCTLPSVRNSIAPQNEAEPGESE